jgi:1-acyl-sn-glycerol-3-phosphate acyltransferase
LLAVDESPALRLVSSKSNPGGSPSEPRRPEARRRRPAAARPVEPTPAEPPPAQASPARPPPAESRSAETASAAPGPAADSEPEGAERAGTDPTPQPSVDPDLSETTAGVEPPEQPAGSPPSVVPSAWQRQLAIALDFWRRRLTGEYEVDDFGFDPDLTANVLVPLLRPVYRTWFRTEVIGIHNLPREGGALLVANHAGGLWAIDGAMTAIAVHETHPDHRYLRMLGADLVFTTPVLGPLARKTGTTLACNADAQRLLNQGELVGVWPEGFKGIGKPFSERYKLQRFGRGGFVSAALRTGVPIIPVSIVGSEEVYPVLGNAKTLARVLNLPYFPLTPTFPWLGPLGVVPLPVKWYIEFGEPIPTADYAAQGVDDPMLVFELTDRVREIIQSTLYRLLMQRRSVWR